MNIIRINKYIYGFITKAESITWAIESEIRFAFSCIFTRSSEAGPHFAKETTTRMAIKTIILFFFMIILRFNKSECKQKI